MTAHSQQLTAPGQTAALPVGKTGAAMVVATAMGVSFTAQPQVRIDDSWQNVGASFSAINTPQFLTDLPELASIRVNVTAVSGSVDLSLQT